MYRFISKKLYKNNLMEHRLAVSSGQCDGQDMVTEILLMDVRGSATFCGSNIRLNARHSQEQEGE